MTSKQKLLLVYALQFIPLLIFPPQTLLNGWAIILVVMVTFGLLGYGLWRGRSWALYLSMFMQGFNVIVRLMMLFPHAIKNESLGGGIDIVYLVTGVLAIILSGWFLLRLDKPDIRATIVG